MLRRLTLGLALLAAAASVAACSSSDSTTPSSGGVPGIGPNFPTNTIYVTNTTQRLIEIYLPSPGPSATPQYTLGGSNTTISGPQYLAFNDKKQLFLTDGTPNGTGSILAFQTYATANVLPLGSQPLAAGIHPHGIAIDAKSGNEVVAATVAGGFYTNEVLIYSSLGLADLIAGSNTGLNVPVGVAVDANSNIYVSNSGSPASVTIYPMPSPTPAPTGSPTATPAPTPTPTGSPAPTPTPTPYANNMVPATTIAGGNTQLSSPQGITLDSAGNLYVADAGASGAAPKILIFSAPFAAGALNVAPSRTIVSQNPAFVNPTDVKVDSAGNVYVVDAGAGPNSNSKLLIFPANANGTVTPTTAITLPAGSATGLALSP
jgi:hypothetical protein